MTKQKGFTLVEVLLVVAFIGISAIGAGVAGQRFEAKKENYRSNKESYERIKESLSDSRQKDLFGQYYECTHPNPLPARNAPYRSPVEIHLTCKNLMTKELQDNKEAQILLSAAMESQYQAGHKKREINSSTESLETPRRQEIN